MQRARSVVGMLKIGLVLEEDFKHSPGTLRKAWGLAHKLVVEIR